MLAPGSPRRTHQEVAGRLQAEVRLLLLEGAPEEGARRLALDAPRDYGGDRHLRAPAVAGRLASRGAEEEASLRTTPPLPAPDPKAGPPFESRATQRVGARQ